MKQVDVSRLVVITTKMHVLEMGIQDAGDEMLAEVKHRHICVEWAQQVDLIFGNLIEYRAAEVTKLGGLYRLSCIEYILECLSECRGTNLSDSSLIPITLCNNEKSLRMPVWSLAACFDSFLTSERKIMGCVCQFWIAKPQDFLGLVRLTDMLGFATGTEEETDSQANPQEAVGEAAA